MSLCIKSIKTACTVEHDQFNNQIENIFCVKQILENRFENV